MRGDAEKLSGIDVEESDGYAHDTSLAALDPAGRLYNEDLAPTKPDGRKWNTYSLFALWMNDAHNLGDYVFAAALFTLGLSAWQRSEERRVGKACRSRWSPYH